jgi:hypothetical protein
MSFKQLSTKQIVKEIKEGVREACDSYIGKPACPETLKTIKSAIESTLLGQLYFFKDNLGAPVWECDIDENDSSVVNCTITLPLPPTWVYVNCDTMEELAVDSPTSKLLPEHVYLDLEDHILSELPRYEDGSKIWKHVRPSPYEGIIVAECPYEQIPAKEYEEVQEYIMNSRAQDELYVTGSLEIDGTCYLDHAKDEGFLEMEHDCQDRDIVVGSGDLKIRNSNDPIFEHSNTEPTIYIHSASTGNMQWEADGTGEVIEEWGGPKEEPEDPHKGMVQNPITGEWKWL